MQDWIVPSFLYPVATKSCTTPESSLDIPQTLQSQMRTLDMNSADSPVQRTNASLEEHMTTDIDMREDMREDMGEDMREDMGEDMRADMREDMTLVTTFDLVLKTLLHDFP